MPKYTVVQHSGFVANDDPDFAKGLESAAVNAKQEEKVWLAGGIVFDDYTAAENYADVEMYREVEGGLIPQAPGKFADLVIDGRRVYMPKRRGFDDFDVKLGDYVEESSYGHKGRVYKLHHWCPEDDRWLAGQQDRTMVLHKQEPWASVLVHNGGSIAAPLAHLTVVPAFQFANPYATAYFREDA